MKHLGIPVIVLEQCSKGSMETLDPWARFVYQVIHTRNFDFLERYENRESVSATRLPPESPLESQPVIWANLHEVGVSLSRTMLSDSLPETSVSATDMPVHTLEELRCLAAVDQLIPMVSVPAGVKSAKPVSDQRLGDRFPRFRNELSELEVYLVRGIFGDESALPKIKSVWSSFTPQLDGETLEVIREEIIMTIHVILMSLEGDGGQRLLRSSQLLELMVFFLHRNSG
jgi:hypothetical protein